MPLDRSVLLSNSLVKVRKSLNPPHWGRKCFYPTFGWPNSALSGTLEGLLELTQPLSRDLNLTSKDTYYGNKRIPAGVAQVHGGPRTPSRATITNLDFVFVRNALNFVVPKIWGPRPPIAPFYDPPSND